MKALCWHGTHRVPLADAPAAYKAWQHKKDGCIKVGLSLDETGSLWLPLTTD